MYVGQLTSQAVLMVEGLSVFQIEGFGLLQVRRETEANEAAEPVRLLERCQRNVCEPSKRQQSAREVLIADS